MTNDNAMAVYPNPDGPLLDGRDIPPDELAELLQATWDGQSVIPSPFVEGDFLKVARRPRISAGEARVMYEWSTFGNRASDYDRLGQALKRVYADWQLTGMFGERIGPPGENEPDGRWPWERLSTRVLGWVINRAVMAVLRNPLA